MFIVTVTDRLVNGDFESATWTQPAGKFKVDSFKLNSFMSYIPVVKEAAWRLGSKYGARGLFKVPLYLVLPR